MTSLTNSGLKPFYTEISFKNGEKRTSDYLNIHTYIYIGPDLAHFFAMKINIVENTTK